MDERNYIIYIIQNQITNKQYIGVSKTSLQRRWITHKSAAKTKQDNFKFPNALRKYGTSDDIWLRYVLTEVVGAKNAAESERQYISQYDTYYNGYNSSIGGELHFGYTTKPGWTDERKQKMSQLHAGKSYHPGKCGKDNPRYGKTGTMLDKTHTNTSKQKMSNNHHKRTPICVHGVQYRSMTVAKKELGWSDYKLQKYIRGQS